MLKGFLNLNKKTKVLSLVVIYTSGVLATIFIGIMWKWGTTTWQLF